MKQIVVGSRDSRLALAQTRQVIAQLEKIAPRYSYLVKTIKTKGDIILDTALAKIGDKGLFVKEIENALLRGEIDMAVHSMKDVPTALPPGLKIGAVVLRDDPRDAVVGDFSLASLPAGSVIGTGSLRRVALLCRAYPRLSFKPVRGNLDTRLRKLEERTCSALILAYAGLRRLGLQELVSEILSPQLCLPAAGQGALAVECRAGDETVEELLALLDHQATRAAVSAERSFVRRLEGGCQVPLGTLGEVKGKTLHLQGVIASLDGSQVVRGEERGNPAEAEILGIRLAERLLAQGGAAILEKVRHDFDARE